MREIRVAIRSGLDADLDHANHWNQHAQEPKPSHEQVRSPASLPNGNAGERRYQQRGAGDFQSALKPPAG